MLRATRHYVARPCSEVLEICPNRYDREHKKTGHIIRTTIRAETPSRARLTGR